MVSYVEPPISMNLDAYNLLMNALRAQGMKKCRGYREGDKQGNTCSHLELNVRRQDGLQPSSLGPGAIIMVKQLQLGGKQVT